MRPGPCTPAELAAIARDGYIIVPDLLDQEEVTLLRDLALNDRGMQSNAFGVEDTQGRKSRLSLWNHPGDDLYGMISRSRRIVDRLEQVLDDEVYHYHSKMMLKEPRVGGAWEWHQDYGYWYNNGCLFPHMASCMIALDQASKENGCLQVLRGSHLLGRIDHGRFGEQTGADPERVKKAAERLDLVYCEMPPGAAIIFHGNTLHRSDANTSERPRWSLICCYNARGNDPYKESHHPHYTPLSKVDDSEVKRVGRAGPSAVTRKSYMRPADDKTIGKRVEVSS